MGQWLLQKLIFMSLQCKLCELLVLNKTFKLIPLSPRALGELASDGKGGRRQMSPLSNYIFIQQQRQSSRPAGLRLLACPKAIDNAYYPPMVRHKSYKLAPLEVAE